MALRGEVIDFVGLNLLDDANQVRSIGHVAEMQEELDVFLMRIVIEMIDALGVERRRTALDAVNDITFAAAAIR